jgi:RNA polymerase sigma-70 factor (ECF subfamily)
MAATSTSLLARLHESDSQAWDRLVELYTPLIRRWLGHVGVRTSDGDDLVQEVLAVVVRRFPDFEHNQRTGAFRAWLRAIAVNCARDFWKANRLRPTAAGGTDFGSYLAQLEDNAHPFAEAWDREHDVHVTRQLLEALRPEFEQKTWEMFKRFVLDGKPAADVATELGTTPNAVFIAKSRVIARLRQEAEGLIED